jgi:hypothetical protein
MSSDDAAGAATARALCQPANAIYRPDHLLGVLSPARLNLLAAASGMGKWPLLLPQLNQYLADRRFFGHTDGRTEAPRVGLLTQDNPARFTSLIKTLKLDLLNPSNFPIIHTPFKDDMIEPIESAYSKFSNRPQLLIVHSLHSYMPSGEVSRFSDVRAFRQRLQSWATERNVTILATVLKAKSKIGQGYERPMDGVLGSVKWVTEIGAFIAIDYPQGHPHTTSHRTVLVAPQLSAWVETEWEFDPLGRLIPAEAVYLWQERMRQHLSAKTPGEPFRTAEIHSWAEQEMVPIPTAKLWIAERVADGELVRIRKGMYKRTHLC